MSLRAGESGLEAGHFDGREIGRLTWIGLVLAGIGWALLLGETASVDILAMRRPVVPTFHADLADIAKCLVASGFGLAVVGALQTGFGALNRFFEAVLMRSAQRAMPSPGQAPGDVTPVQVTPVQVTPVQATPVRATPVQATPRPDAARKPSKRPYRLLADGSVEVDTILGTRLFETMAEARDFI